MSSFKSNGVACPSKERLLLNRNTLRFRAYSRQKEKMAIRHFLLKHDYKLTTTEPQILGGKLIYLWLTCSMYIKPQTCRRI